MKTKITFELESATEVKIMREGKQIGQLWSEFESGTLPYPHDDKGYCHNSIQLCGWDKLDGPWACGPFTGKRDLVVHFRDDTGEYMQDQIKQYGRYVQKFLEAKVIELKSGVGKFHVAKMETKLDLTKLKNFDDWFRSGDSI